jgi:cytochrome c oxidase accessory protein FixG
VFLDHVNRRIERWIDGDAVRRRTLAAAPLSAGKIVRRVLKHALYLLVSAAIAHLFLAYFVSIPELWAMMRAAPAEHWSLFVFMGVATGVLYFNFAWFREQLCIVICPYGRIQSALTDDNTLVIGYDAKRGEPRGRHRPAAGEPRVTFATALARVSAGDASLLPAPGDCVACNRCVQVCPTGIDIRQGLQMECIGCAGCIDACDDVMTRLGRPRGLIRYDSQNAFHGRRTRWLRPRTLLYGLLLFLGASVATWALSTVHSGSFGVTRLPGAPYVVDATAIRNQFLVRLVNKRSEPVMFVLTVRSVPEGLRQNGFEAPVVVPAMGEDVRPLILQQTRARYTGPFHFEVEVSDRNSSYHLTRDVEFLGPEAALLREDEAAQKSQ